MTYIIPAEYLDQSKEIESLRAELAECREDAERYRYIRTGESTEVELAVINYCGTDLDAIVDAAIAAKEG